MSKPEAPPQAASTTAIALDKPKAFQDALLGPRYRERLELMLADSDVSVERWVGMTVQALARDPKLLAPSIDRESLMLAILTVAEMGLTPTGEGGAHLVPYKGKVQPIIDWRAFIKMAMRSGQLATAWTALVYEGDEFSYEIGDTPRLYHAPALTREASAKVTHVYAVAQLLNGAKAFEVMTLAEVEAIRKRAQHSDQSPWVTDPGEMYRKTAVRRLFKYLPVAVTPALAAALAREDAIEAAAATVTVSRANASPRQQRLLAHAAGAEAPDEPNSTPVYAGEAGGGLPEMGAAPEAAVEGNGE